MKKLAGIFLIFWVLFIIPATSNGQAKKKLHEQWSNLQRGLLRHTEEAKQFVIKWPGPENDRADIEILSERIDAQIKASEYPNKLAIASIIQLNESLAKSLEDAFMLIETDSVLKSNQDLIEAQARLAGTQNRVVVLARNYNAQVSKMKRPDLIFDLKDRGLIPKVIFD